MGTTGATGRGLPEFHERLRVDIRVIDDAPAARPDDQFHCRNIDHDCPTGGADGI